MGVNRNLATSIVRGCQYIRKSEDNICEDCKKTDTDLLICSECNKHICPDCATEDFDGNVYCQECYDKKDGVSL